MIALVVLTFLVVLGALMLSISSGLRYFESKRRKQLVSVLRTVSETEEPHVNLLIDPDAQTKDSDRLPGPKALYDKLNLLMSESGLDWNMSKLMMFSGGGFAIGCILGGLVPFESPVFLRGFAGGSVLAWLPLMYVRKKRTKRLDEMEAQLPDALDFLARSMRAGHAFTISLEMVGEEIHDPLGQEFRALFNEQNLGASLDRSLGNFGKRVPLPDVRFFSSAVLLQRQTGGNLGEVLGRLSHIIRERFRLKGQVKATSAHGRLTAMILTLLPLATLGGLIVVSPTYLSPLLTDPLGRKLVVAGVVCQVLGNLVIRKIIRSGSDPDPGKTQMLAILLAGFLFLLLLGVITMYGYRAYVRPSRIYDRVGGSAETVQEPGSKPRERMARFVEQIGGKIPLSSSEQTMTRRDLTMAGFRSDSAIAIFYGVKVIGCVLMLLVGFAVKNSLSDSTVPQMVILVGCTGFGYYAPTIGLEKLVKARQMKLRLSLPDALDMLVVAVEAGLGLDQALQYVSREITNGHPELADELGLVGFEMRAGKRRAESLRNLATRTGEAELRKLVAILTQSDRFGTSMGESLRTHSDFMRLRRKQDAEERAAKIGVKLVFPIFLFILPSMMLVAAGPALLKIFQDLFPMMQSFGK